MGSCIGCPSGNIEGGLVVRLLGAADLSCQTSALDHPERQDYITGQEVRFDGQPDGGLTDGLEGCYLSPMEGQLNGGSVTWTGSGMFAANKREVCVEMSASLGSTETWCCTMDQGYSSTNVAVQISNCKVV